MSYKSYLLLNNEKLYRIKNLIETMDNHYFTTTIINKTELDENTISIVMTACNRSVQTYFTIESISKSIYKNIQIILIDDSTNDFCSIEKLEQYHLHIELIHIKNKFWINPCVNYNIGFKHVKGGKIIIQNAEVCHMDDIVNDTTHINDNEYHVVNVYALHSIHENNLLYQNHDITSLAGQWYQHHIHRNANFHFLSMLTTETFKKMNGFDIDYALGIEYDDNDFIFRIMHNGIKTINVDLMGVHQWHIQSAAGSYSGQMNNRHLDQCKIKYYTDHQSFLNLTSYHKDEIKEIINKYIK